MGAAQSRLVCDNTLSRLPPHLFVDRLKRFCERVEQICDDYFERGLDPIMYHATLAYIQKHHALVKHEKKIVAPLVADMIARLERFIADVRELRITVTRMGIIANHIGPASFLEQLSANPICAHILSEMGCSTMMVGGAITTFKEVIRQECWRNEKLTDFFSRLGRYLIETFGKFNVVSTSQIEHKGQLLDLRMQILQDPNFAKEELSPVALVIKEVLLEIKMDQLRALVTKTPNVRGA
jgi:hypothetical protein